LIDTYNRMREDGVKDIRQAVIKTAAQRLRPILLTTGTTILGLIPMALQINFNFFTQTTSVGGITSIWWVQLSTAIISGLAYSTVLTLIMIPTLLALPHNASRILSFRANRKQKLSDKAAASAAQAPAPAQVEASPEQVEQSPAVVETAPEPKQVEEVAAEAKPKVKRPRKKKVAAEVANENIDTPHSEAAE